MSQARRTFRRFFFHWLMSLSVVTASLAQTTYEKSRLPEQRISFKNSGGLFKSGVCWWHSRLQRAFWSQAVFQPGQPKPTLAQARAIIQELEADTSPVEIPGYSNVQDFTLDFAPMIKRQLTLWQLTDGLHLGFLRGLQGHSKLTAHKLKSHLDQLYQEYLRAQSQDEVLWLLLQFKGLVTHSALLISMEPDGQGGYSLDTVDSQFPADTVEYWYETGDESLTAHFPLSSTIPIGTHGGDMVPYVGFRRHLRSDNK